MRLDIDQVKREAQGRWPGIVSSFGIEVGSGKHTYCPICHSEKKWFRFDDLEGNGTFICNHCGAGDGFSLVRQVLGIDFKETLSEVARLCGVVKKSAVLPEKKVDAKKLRKMFMDSQKMTREDPAGVYLRARGISLVPDTLRYTHACWNTELKKEIPAMLAVVTSSQGKALTIHRTYLTIDGRKAEVEDKKKLMPGLEKITGGAIRLFPPEDGVVGLAEGIETALACYELFGVPCWAAVSSTLMEKFEPPKGIKEVFIYSDNDNNYAGQKAAFTLANTLVIKHKLKVDVKIPAEMGTDFADTVQP